MCFNQSNYYQNSTYFIGLDNSREMKINIFNQFKLHNIPCKSQILNNMLKEKCS